MRKLLFIPLTLLAAAAGCGTESVKVVEGVDLSVGMSLPATDGEVTMTVFNWLSGFKCTADDGRVDLWYSCAESNDFFGIVHTRVTKEVEAKIYPQQDEQEEPAKSAGGAADPL